MLTIRQKRSEAYTVFMTEGVIALYSDAMNTRSQAALFAPMDDEAIRFPRVWLKINCLDGELVLGSQIKRPATVLRHGPARWERKNSSKWIENQKRAVILSRW